MKKIIAIISLFLTGTVVVADMNMPEAPTAAPKVPYSSRVTAPSKTTTSTNNYQKNTGTSESNLILASNPKAQLDALAMSVLKAAERRDENAADMYIMKMMDIGITGLSEPQVIAKQTPNCPPIQMELNGQHLKGSLCAKVGYEFKEREYWVGYCK